MAAVVSLSVGLKGGGRPQLGGSATDSLLVGEQTRRVKEVHDGSGGDCLKLHGNDAGRCGCDGLKGEFHGDTMVVSSSMLKVMVVGSGCSSFVSGYEGSRRFGVVTARYGEGG
ncbi:hypothetical protein L1987_15372 [Smallanthus sonchifolius]|uniref:Uncharacterized protein n=1 Tax=Smallanthus sonchifolius TaxID=185202 RepID=A0ACB9J5F5_9ASTR|nr:hypothetical protein L1987_15372 [Smallanthus sonchifolius]